MSRGEYTKWVMRRYPKLALIPNKNSKIGLFCVTGVPTCTQRLTHRHALVFAFAFAFARLES